MKNVKKFFSIMMTALLLLSTFIAANADTTAETYTIDAVNDVMPGGQGVGFFDNTANSTATAPEKLEGGVIPRPMSGKVEEAEWVKYPIPATLTAGTYNVQVNASSTSDTYINIGVNGTDVLEAKRVSTTSYSTFEWTDCGNVYLDRNYASCLKISNANGIGVGDTAAGNFSVKEIKLTKVNSDIAPTEVQAESYYTKDVWSNTQIFPSGGISTKYTEFFAGNKLTYDISFLPRGQYTLSVRAATNHTPKLNVYLNGTLATTLPSITKGNWNNYNDHSVGTVDIKPGNDGLKTISLENLKAGTDDGKCQVDSFTLTYVGELAEIYEFNGYSDIYTYNDGANTTAGVPNENGGALIRPVCSSLNTSTWGEEGKEWVKYKLPASLTAGTYKVELKAAHNYDNTWANIGIDDTDVLEAKLTKTGWGSSNAQWNDCGTLYLDTDYAECIRVSSAGNVGVGNSNVPNPFAINAVRLTKVNNDITPTVVQSECYSVKNSWSSEKSNYVFPKGGISTYSDFFPGDKLTYDVSFLPSGEYSLSVRAATNQTPNINVYVNGTLKETMTSITKAGWASFNDNNAANMVKLHLDPSENKNISLEVIKGGTDDGKCVIDSFTLTYVGPYQGTVVLDSNGVETDEVVEGTMSYVAEIGDFGDGNEVMVTFAVYKQEVGSQFKQLYKMSSIKTSSDSKFFTDVVTNIEKESGYEYSYKVFVWKTSNLMGYCYSSTK